MSLIQALVKKGTLEKGKAGELEYEIKKSGKSEEEVLLGKGIVPEQVLFSLKSEIIKIPLKEIPVEEIPLKVLEMIPEESAKYYKMIPLAKKDNIVRGGDGLSRRFEGAGGFKIFIPAGKFACKIFFNKPSTFLIIF